MSALAAALTVASAFCAMMAVVTGAEAAQALDMGQWRRFFQLFSATLALSAAGAAGLLSVLWSLG